jgi:hypothetical protein
MGVRLTWSLRAVFAFALGASILGVCAWAGGARTDLAAAIQPTYDKETGKLTELSYDSDHDGRPDTWTDMDGAKPLRTRIDRNGDGRIDRWEEYDAAGALVRVGASTKDNGVADTWLSPAEDRSIERVETDTIGDGKPHKWETYRDGILETIAFDEDGDGLPDRRFTYRGSALIAIESQRDPTGHYAVRTELGK